MAGGQQIAGSQGVIIALGGAGNVPATGSASTSAVGTTAPNEIIGLRSKKTGTGSAAPFLTGQASSTGIGTLTFVPGIVLLGQAIPSAQGSVTYQGLALLSWNANTEPDLAFYSVFHGLAPNVPDFEVEVGLATSYQLGPLAPGVTHYFWLTATDTSDRESPKSTVVSKAY